jgi:hypothetical protein
MRLQLKLFGGLALFASAAGLLILRELPYSTARITAVEAVELRRAPTPDFTVGPLTWRVSALQEDAALGPFRDAMRGACGDSRGLAAAACATRILHDRVPPGDPSTEYVDRHFDPIAHFHRHMGGEPGHCLTRSAILASELLSVGIPSRVIQMVPSSEDGHTLVEVWDDSLGWVVVDPSTDGYVVSARGPALAIDLLTNRENLEWKAFDHISPSPSEIESMRLYFRHILSGSLLYPEPWLYLRLGPRVGSWPTRGQYVRAGPMRLTLGPIQHALVVAIPLLGLLGAALVFAGWRRQVAFRPLVWTQPQRSGAREIDDLDALPPA